VIGDYFPTNQSKAFANCFTLIGWKVIANRQLPIGNRHSRERNAILNGRAQHVEKITLIDADINEDFKLIW